MGPKKKKGNKSGALKKKLSAARKAFYTFQVKELQKYIGRLKSYSIQLENQNEDLRKELEVLDTDRADVISLLKRRLSEKDEELKQLEERTESLQEAKDSEKKFLKGVIKQRDTEHKQLSEQLISEIKLLNGKLNSLEEYKLHRDELMAKFGVQEEALEEQERTHKRTVYEIEKKFIISKDKLRKDMEERLLKLSLDFKKATQIRIASTTQSVIRENIAINNELSLLIGSWQKLFDENEALKLKNKELTNEVDLAENQKTMALNRNVVQSQVINRLAQEHQQILKSYEEVQQYKRIIKSLEDRIQDQETKRRCAEQHENEQKQSKEKVLAQLQSKTREFNELCNVNHVLEKKLKITILTIKQIIDLPKRKSKGGINDEQEREERDHLLKYILDLFDCDDLTSDVPDLRNASVETLYGLENKFRRGDLGLFQKRAPFKGKGSPSAAMPASTSVQKA
ncbi:cilia- and flagella-associated protein 157 [Cimex lectularius]|uniref:Cilia- and flagella-associated protein 157 n=1 Tax=Cimex lectularius TaxID=79782 RepID=A0A8I6S480_CIMLE|nr:cilia- and flagella-associated protein 157 [Cimex lectularius]